MYRVLFLGSQFYHFYKLLIEYKAEELQYKSPSSVTNEEKVLKSLHGGTREHAFSGAL